MRTVYRVSKVDVGQSPLCALELVFDRHYPDAGEDWRQKEKGMAEEEMVGWHHRLNGCESEQAPGGGIGQGSLACCRPRGRKESATTEWLNSKNNLSNTHSTIGLLFIWLCNMKKRYCSCLLLMIIPEFSGLKQGAFIFVLSPVVMHKALLPVSPEFSQAPWLARVTLVRGSVGRSPAWLYLTPSSRFWQVWQVLSSGWPERRLNKENEQAGSLEV